MATRKKESDSDRTPDIEEKKGKVPTTTRSIKVKLNLHNSNGPEQEELRQHFKTTHEIYHAGVRYYQEWLLLMRQGDVHFSHEDETDSKSSTAYTAELWEKVKEARKRNIALLKSQKQEVNFKEIKGKDKEILGLIREYFDLICPAGGGDGGQAQEFMNALVLINARLPGVAGTGADNKFQKRMKAFFNDYPEIKNELVGDKEIPRIQLEGLYKKLLKMRSRFTGDQKEKFEHVEKGFIETQKEGTKKAEGKGRIFKTLKDYGVFPLFPRYLKDENDYIPSFLRSKEYNESIDVSAAFDYSMWSRAAVSIRPWNTWDSMQRKRIESMKSNIEDAKSTLAEHDPENQSKALESYERKRNTELKKIAENPDDSFIISARVIRSLDEVIDAWKKNGRVKLQGSRQNYGVNLAIPIFIAGWRKRKTGHYGKMEAN